MRISVLTIGAIASIITTAAFANQVITSQTYVDNADALKQDKITAGTTGNVVTYNGAQNGQTQFSERAIFNFETGWDDENGEIVSGHEGDLLEAGSIVPELYNSLETISGMRKDLNWMNSALQGTAGNVITYNENGYAGGSRGIYDGSTTYDSSTDADKLVTASVVQNATNLPEKPLHTELVPVGLMVSHIPMQIVCCGIWWMKPFMARSVIQMQTVVRVTVLASIICVIVESREK